MAIKSAIVGKIGEDIACKYLIHNGYSIIERNFRMKFGEIDIICQKNKILHFVEVKSVSQVTSNISNAMDKYNPEDNMHRNKVLRQKRVISVYLSGLGVESDFQVDLITVKLDSVTKQAIVRIHKNIIL